MLNYFCPKCGGKNIYQFQKPKFCSNCGLSFSAELSSISNIKNNKFDINIIKKTSLNKDNLIEQIEDKSNYTTDYSSMRGLQVNIEKFNNNSIRLGDLMSDEPIQKQKNSDKKQIKQKRGRKKIAKSLPENFISEAKMSGRNYSNEFDIIDDEQ